LATDDEREKKARRATPGTYNVVFRPCSFQHLPEYSDVPVEKVELSFQGKSPPETSFTGSLSGGSAAESANCDANVAVLARFDDVARRNPRRVKKGRLIALCLEPNEPAIEEIKGPVMRESPDDIDHRGTENEARYRYLQQFRGVIWKQLVPERDDNPISITTDYLSVQLMEQISAMFPPASRELLT
jgi:hypothetical protein